MRNLAIWKKSRIVSISGTEIFLELRILAQCVTETCEVYNHKLLSPYKRRDHPVQEQNPAPRHEQRFVWLGAYRFGLPFIGICFNFWDADSQTLYF